MRHEAIRKAHPNVSTISINDTETVALDKDNKVVSLDETKILEETKKLQAEYDAKKYQRDRLYPKISDQLDMIYWDKKNGTKNWEEAIDKVKSDNPKPT